MLVMFTQFNRPMRGNPKTMISARGCCNHLLACLLALTLACGVAGCGPSFGHDAQFNQGPGLLLSPQEINEIKQRLQQEPWQQAYEQLRMRANKALTQKPSPVKGEYPVDKRPPRWHYKAANRDANRALDMALMYQFSGDDAYAQQVRQVVMAWVDSMDTDINGYQAGIELSITMPQLLWAADLIWQSAYLSTNDKRAIRAWAHDLGQAAIEAKRFCCGATHNIHNWEWFLISAMGVMSQDKAMFDYGIDQYKTVLSNRFEPNLLLKSEGARTFEYAWFGLKALTMLAELARHQGVDLYDYEVGAGENRVSLHKVSLAHTRWFLDKSYPGTEPNYDLVVKEELDLAEVWYSKWGDPEFKQAALVKGRPAYDLFVLGPVTLTHGERKLQIVKPRSKTTH